MTDDTRDLAVEGVRFFGEMTASITHEIKNVLAIINENAGLLQDMVRMAEKGMPLSPQRLSVMAQSISRQVNRGDRIVKGMNRFAHSADYAQETVDVGETIHFIADLAARIIARQGADPQIETPAAPLTTVTNRFFLENLVWTCLCRAMAACTADRTVSVVADKTDNAVRIRFSGLPGGFIAAVADFPSPQEKVVAQLLGARLTVETEKGEINLTLP